MTSLLKSILLAATVALFSSGAYAAKDEAKPAASAPAKASASKPADKAADKAADKPGDAAKAGEMIDLNTATEKELMTLPQIGDARAKAIIKARPFNRKDELVSKKIVTQAVYDGIKDKVIAKQGAGSKASSKASADKAAEKKK